MYIVNRKLLYIKIKWMTAYSNSTDFYVYQRVWFLLTSLFPQPNKLQFICIMLNAYANIANMGMGSWQSLGIKHIHLQYYHCPLHCNVVIIIHFHWKTARLPVVPVNP